MRLNEHECEYVHVYCCVYIIKLVFEDGEPQYM
jgi:hypothetical protein